MSIFLTQVYKLVIFLMFLLQGFVCLMKILLVNYNYTSVNTMYCGGEFEQQWMYYLCTDFTTLSKWHYISECIEISVVQFALEWLVSHNLFYKNITLDKRFVVACKLPCYECTNWQTGDSRTSCILIPNMLNLHW